MLLLFFLFIDLCLLNAKFIVKIVNPTAELVYLIGIQTKEATAEIEMHPVTAEAKIRVVQTFFVLLTH